MSAHDLAVFLDGLQRLGHDKDRLLAAAGISAAELARPDARVPDETCARMFSAAQTERFTPNLALELARVTPLGAWPLLDYLVLTADSVGAGAHHLAQYFQLIGAPVTFIVKEDVDPIRLEIVSALQFAIEYDAALAAFHFHNETEGRFAPSAMHFRHRLQDPSAFERVFACPIHSNASWSGISIARESWELPLRRRDPVLRQVLEHHAKEMLAKLPARKGLAAKVQRALSSRVTAGDTRIKSVAAEFAMAPRTLQRKLALERVSYQGLLDETRKQAAGKYIGDSDLAICEIAYLLGYAEPAPFHRAFKRWYRVTPESYRERSATRKIPQR